MGIETWNEFPRSLKHYASQGVPLPCSDQNPRLKCPETRWAMNWCLAIGGMCEYKIEAHFDCLLQYYPRERVELLRKSFRPGVLDVPVSDHYIRYRHFYGAHCYSGKASFTGLY